MGTGIYLTYVKVGIRNRLTGFYQSNNDIADILTCLIFLFYLKTGIKQLLFSSSGVTSTSTYSFNQLNGNIMILFSSRLFLVDLL